MSIEPNKVVAAVAKENHQIELLDFDFPKINSTTGTLKIEMTGMCGSDWPYFLNYPQTKGPENASSPRHPARPADSGKSGVASQRVR